ncbi:hypothetical protein VSS37_03255 [Candidatus Thiothrix sp. Deng01]|uniref:Uncharacterized protein n=1 Tax=Candidatus Thiothrix phosphatis TaxID=3112415 RepID=A0ABU6CV94_9GAMM|nr:hypothetical protein [Candidatus Thiothrix sp. Deng01]MEB4589987.1 hypothetical protein [Candidatus Thiothrix sp. Deng01]
MSGFGGHSNLLSVGVGGIATLAAGASILSQVAGGVPILDVSSNVPVNIITTGIIGASGVGLAASGNKMAGVMGLGLVVLALANGNVNFNGNQASRFAAGVAQGVKSAAVTAASATQKGVSEGWSQQYGNPKDGAIGVSFDGWLRVRPLNASELEWCGQGNNANATEKGQRNCSSGYVWKQNK